jgi:hypothetical protein
MTEFLNEGDSGPTYSALVVASLGIDSGISFRVHGYSISNSVYLRRDAALKLAAEITALFPERRRSPFDRRKA